MNNILIKLSGILGIIFGLIALIIAFVFPSKNLLIALLTTISLILLIICFIFYFEPFKAFSKKRSTQLGLNSILMIALFLFIAIILNLMARQYYLRIDLSSTSSYSLAPQTVDVIKNLDSKVTITVFTQHGSPSFKKAEQILEGYRYLNRNIIYSVLDLDRNPLLARELGVSSYDSVVVKGEGSSVVAHGISEETITNAIIKATRKLSKKIYFVTGHGERDIYDGGRFGMSKTLEKLLSLGYEVYTLNLSSVDAMPDDVDILIIAGPKERFDNEEVAILEDYMARGGKIIALFDPGYDSSLISGRAGIRLGGGMVIDPSLNLGGRDKKIPLVMRYPETPITRDFKLTTVYPGVAPLEVGGLERIYEYFSFVTTSTESKLMKADKIIDEEGGYVIAAVAGSKEGKDIIMVFGDSDFVSNAFFDVMGNGNLFINSINWVADQGELISIAPRKDEFIPLYLTPKQSKAIMYISVIIIPFFVFGSGSFMWWRRRRL